MYLFEFSVAYVYVKGKVQKRERNWELRRGVVKSDSPSRILNYCVGEEKKIDAVAATARKSERKEKWRMQYARPFLAMSIDVSPFFLFLTFFFFSTVHTGSSSRLAKQGYCSRPENKVINMQPPLSHARPLLHILLSLPPEIPTHPPSIVPIPPFSVAHTFTARSLHTHSLSLPAFVFVFS